MAAIKIPITIRAEMYRDIQALAKTSGQNVPQFMSELVESSIAGYRLETLPPPDMSAQREANRSRVAAWRERHRNL